MSADDITRAPDGRPAEAQPAWRRDFPIDTAADQYLWRRDFMKFLVLTSLAFTAGQFWIGASNWWRRRRGLPPGQTIARVDDLAAGATLVFNYPTAHDPCVLVRMTDGTFVAYSQKCTHLSCAVIPDPAKSVLRCPCHEGLFDLHSGRPLAGPPQRPLPGITIAIESGVIYATGVTERMV